MTDVVIIGAGVIGCAIARELSRYRLDVIVLEKEADVAEGTSKANSGIVHAGYDATPGSLKAKFNARGSAMFPNLVKELEVPYKRNGSLVVSFSEENVPRLEELLENGKQNGIEGLEILHREQALEKCPRLSEKVVAALYAKTAAIVCPYELTLAYAENAFNNGVRFRLNSPVLGINRIENGYKLTLSSGDTLETRIIVNAAGLYADAINNMVSARTLEIIPRKGEYCLFDHAAEELAPLTIFQTPTAMGKGVLVTTTADGNLLVGPTAVDVGGRDETDTSREGLEYVLKTAALSVGTLPERQIITSFAGLRAHLETDDFEIGEAPDAEGFINVAGIESPGLSSAPAIGEWVAELLARKLSAEPNPSFDPIRRGIPKFREMDSEERTLFINKNPSYGRVVCRCETVTEAEIIDAIRRPLGATTLDGIKRRTRAGMGRCQSGFCTTRVLEILERELKIPRETVTKFGKGSELLTGRR
ncbi:MAG: FAD/NAD(P)-binding oxidoreductase [Firmicutes bacterium HGW-Firmicutes-16]|nr:MAG: FAD/NAD(P)-binding oxidoreductase [Firmicutes bacterium HGW-Firmicutes-16]